MDIIKEYKRICDCGCIIIKLMPDFGSNGLWCAKCGEIITEENIINLPIKLLTNIKIWNNKWKEYIFIKCYKNYKAPFGFNKHGLKLAQEINKYHPCVLKICDEDEE